MREPGRDHSLFEREVKIARAVPGQRVSIQGCKVENPSWVKYTSPEEVFINYFSSSGSKSALRGVEFMSISIADSRI